MILETERLWLREMTQADFPDLCAILQDRETMYAYAHAFDDAEAQAWLDKQLGNYAAWGFGLWAVLRRGEDRLIGQCGLTWQDWEGQRVLEVGYLFNRACWHQGYATEAAIACKTYAFEHGLADTVYSIIRDNNIASQNVARRNGMQPVGRFVKHYYGIDMPHMVFAVQRTGDG